jgi:hypothetical protein
MGILLVYTYFLILLALHVNSFHPSGSLRFISLMCHSCAFCKTILKVLLTMSLASSVIIMYCITFVLSLTCFGVTLGHLQRLISKMIQTS